MFSFGGKKLGISFFRKFETLSNTSSFLSIFFGSQGGQWTAKGALCKDQSLKHKVSYNEKSLNIHVSWQYFVKGNVISSKRNQETIVTNVWVVAFFNDKIEEKHMYTYRHLNLLIKYKMKNLKRDICCIVRKISRGCKKK